MRVPRCVRPASLPAMRAQRSARSSASSELARRRSTPSASTRATLDTDGAPAGIPGLFGIIEHPYAGMPPPVIDAILEFFDTYLRGSWTSIVDFLLVSFVIYWLFILIRGTRAVRIVIGLSILLLVYLGAIVFWLVPLTTLLATSATVVHIPV